MRGLARTEQHLAAFIPQGYETRGRILESSDLAKGVAGINRQSCAQFRTDREQVADKIVRVAICALN
jgi:hypothetical protein